MTRLPTEFDRLFRAGPTALFADGHGRVRALVLEVVQPAGWDVLSPLWQGVQAELALPAPAIAVSGVDSLQLWFSLESPVVAEQGHAFLAALRERFLPGVPAARVRLWPDPAAPARQPALVPALQAATGNWSAFVSPDLVAVFSDTPWLDIEPGDEGQSALLRGLASIKPAAFAAALARLQADSRANAPAPAPTPAPAAAPAAVAAPARDGALPAATPPAPEDEPRRFLLRVMNDETVEMALRIEAAKALLQR